MRILTKDEIFSTLKRLISSAEKEILITSPWIKSEILRQILPQNKNLKINVIIRASKLEDLLITDPDVFDILDKYPKANIYLNPDLHAKIVIIDENKAIVGSANLTKAGLLEDGNIETSVLIENKKEIKKLKHYFKEIKEKSLDIKNKIFGFIINSTNSREAEAVLLKKIPEQTYIKIPIDENAFYLGRISSIKNLNLGIFSSYENTVFKNLLTKVDQINQIFQSKNSLWESSAFLSYLFENRENIYIASIEILAEFNPKKVKEKESILKTPLEPPKSGTVITGFEEDIKNILKINHAGYEMSMPVEFGNLFNTNIPVFLDLEKITTMHMAVLGTTGSGKTTLIRRILEHLNFKNIKTYIFDIYGEYFANLQMNKEIIDHVVFDDVLFPITVEDLKELLKEEGINIQEKSSEEKRVLALFRSYLKPDINILAFKEKNLEDIILEAIDLTDVSGILKKELIEFLEILKRDFGEDSLNNQSKTIKKIHNSLSSSHKNIVIFNLSKITDLKSRINLSGIIMKEIFKTARETDLAQMVILEEAQNFAPEKGYGEIPSGVENISYLMARKIATEGRKFNLGLIAITQRPASISKFILSQLNTQAIFKLINKNDLEAVSVFFEFSKQDVYNLLPFLKPGTVFITGLAVPFGILAEIKLG